MKSEFSTQWIKSRQPRKQRKYRYNAPLHVRHRFLSVNLSKELRKKYGKRNLPLRKGDEVIIMRGGFSKKKGKITSIDYGRSKIIVDGITRKKIDGSKVNVFLDPSSLQIITLNVEDSRRIKILGEKKEKNAPEKKSDN